MTCLERSVLSDLSSADLSTFSLTPSLPHSQSDIHRYQNELEQLRANIFRLEGKAEVGESNRKKTKGVSGQVVMAIKNLYARSVTSSRLSTGVSTHISSGKGEDTGLTDSERKVKHLSEALSYIGGRIGERGGGEEKGGERERERERERGTEREIHLPCLGLLNSTRIDRSIDISPQQPTCKTSCTPTTGTESTGRTDTSDIEKSLCLLCRFENQRVVHLPPPCLYSSRPEGLGPLLWSGLSLFHD